MQALLKRQYFKHTYQSLTHAETSARCSRTPLTRPCSARWGGGHGRRAWASTNSNALKNEECTVPVERKLLLSREGEETLGQWPSGAPPSSPASPPNHPSSTHKMVPVSDRKSLLMREEARNQGELVFKGLRNKEN